MQLLIGGLIGLLGQLLYFMVGSKKNGRGPSKKSGKTWNHFDPTVMICALLLSFATGVFTSASILHLSQVS